MATADTYLAQFEANLGYDVNQSVTECKLFITACRAILVLRPTLMSVDGTQLSFSNIQMQLEVAQKWLRANGGAGGNRVAARRWDMRDIR